MRPLSCSPEKEEKKDARRSQEEAAVRLKLKAAGEEVEFGTHYANDVDGDFKDGIFQAAPQYTKEGVGIAPVQVGADDDDE